MPDAVILFAAGFGTRMRELTADRPKPMVPVAGKPLIDHALEQVAGYGPLRTVVNLHYKPEPLEQHLAGREVILTREEPDILETGGGLKAALPLLGAGPVFVMNTDSVWRGPNALRVLAEAWDPERMDGLLLCAPRARVKGHKGKGDFLIGADGRITPGPGHVYLGLQILKPEGLAEVHETSFSLWKLWDRMLEAKRLYAVDYPGQWCDVGSPEGVSIAEDMLTQPADV